MTVNAAAPLQRLGVWTETPDQWRQIESKLPKYRRSLMPVYYHGQELANIINAGHLDGVIVFSDKLPLVKVTVGLLEQQCPCCSRFVVCTREEEAAFRAWEGFPPAILKYEESPEVWTDRIERAVLVNQWLMKPEFRMVLPRLRTIPSLPESHRRVVEALRDPEFEVDNVSRIISQDVALTAQLLKIVNSATLGWSQPVNSIPTAISVLGVTRLQSLVMSAWAFSFADEKMCKGFSPAEEWQHALAVAQAAEFLAKEKKAKVAVREEAFTAGILHDMGKVMLAANSPEAYAGILAIAKKQHQPLYEVEREVLGYTHAEVGGCLLGLWGLDLSIVKAVAEHHSADTISLQEVSGRALVYEANENVRADQNKGGKK